MEATKLSGRQLGSSSIEKESCAVQTFRNKIQLPTGRLKKTLGGLVHFVSSALTFVVV
jgi:hypothetical protein